MGENLALSGRYRLDGPIGRGGMGEVWRGTDLRLGRPVAVKLLSKELVGSASARRRFEREAAAAAVLRHRGIAVVYDSGFDETTGQLFFVMELLEGEDLQRVLDRNPAGLPPEVVRDHAAQIAAALGEAHERGVVHRDVKPANVIVQPDGELKICDFGIARLDASRGSLTQGAIGTPSYMAPEQFRNEEVDGRADLYSLGCLLYALASGRPPFVADSVPALLYQHLNAAPRPLTEVRPGFPADLAAYVAQLLAKDPAGRPPSGRILAGALRGHAVPSTGPVEASPSPHAPPTLPSGRGAARSRAAVAVAAAAVVVVGAAAAAAWALSGDDEKKVRETPQAAASAPASAPASPAGPPRPASVPDGWYVLDPASYQAPDCPPSGSGYLLNVDAKIGSVTFCDISAGRYSDVALSTTVTLTGAQCASLILRRAEPFSYEFVVCANGGGFARKWTRDDAVLLTEKGPGDPIAGPVTLTAVAQGGTLSLSLNGTPFHSVRDSQIEAGGVALGTSVIEDGTASTLPFTDLTVWTPAAPIEGHGTSR
ncbi:serine/threonine protein kinase [Actinocorallia herbida]|uniref:non-specific serine/threonine protein kinase n=1 Tax=Actinocorallia herbida TaxID=58109 RepID=A0A3N1CNS2_9ACTN|nr:serine/threonine-protein kinase [Actinocorallia herbida]ROO82960.1 serine/threonine protein kinase [Actinocorallia herbida]